MMDKERGTVEALFCDFESLNFEMCKREREPLKSLRTTRTEPGNRGNATVDFWRLGPHIFWPFAYAIKVDFLLKESYHKKL